MSMASSPPRHEAGSREQGRLKERAALASVMVSFIMTLAKLAAGLASGSLAVLSEAGHNLGDVVAALLSYFAIKVARKPADEDHPFGHAKVEALGALAETGFLFALSVFILIEAIARLTRHEALIEVNAFVVGVLIASIAVDFVRYLALRKIAARTKSDALAAGALHFSSDIMGSLLALCGIGAAYYGYPEGDALAALGLVVFIAGAGFRIGWRTVNTLIDTAPKGLATQLRAIAQSVPGVVDVETPRLRPSGSEVIGDMAITVPRTLPLENAAAIEAQVASAIAEHHPEVTVKVAAQPVALDEETLRERVLLIAVKRHLPVHHVTVQEIGGRISISFDVELDGRMHLGNAHELVSELEMDIRRDAGQGVEVESHIEPLETRHLRGQDAPVEIREKINAALGRLSANGPISDVHSIRVRATADGLVVNYHCRVSPNLTVSEAHAHVDELDHKMRAAFPAIVRIVGHAEPVKI